MQSQSVIEPPGFSELSKAEQVSYLQKLWDLIAEQPGQIPVPESHLNLAEGRLAEYRLHPEGSHPAHEVINHLAKKLR